MDRERLRVLERRRRDEPAVPVHQPDRRRVGDGDGAVLALVLHVDRITFLFFLGHWTAYCFFFLPPEPGNGPPPPRGASLPKLGASVSKRCSSIWMSRCASSGPFTIT